MGERRYTYIAYANADTYDSPTAAPDPWFADTSNSGTLTHNGLDAWLLSSDAGELLGYYKRFDYGAVSTFDGPLRVQDDLEIQFKVAVNTSGSYAAGDSFALILFDGSRASYLYISDKIVYSGAVGDDTEIRPDDFSASEPHVYLLRKVGRERVELYIDGALALTVPYVYTSTASALNEPALVGIYSIGTAAAVGVTWYWGEVSCNMPLAPQWKVENAFYQLHPTVQRHFNADARALLRAQVGQMEAATRGINAFPGRLGAGRVPLGDTYRFDGDILPTAVDPAWVATSGQISVVRDRILTNGTNGDGTITATLTALADDDEIVMYARARMKLESYSAGLNALVFHGLTLQNEHVYVKASLYETGSTGAGTQFGWTIREGDPSTGTASITGRYWNVDPYQDTLVELVAISDKHILLLVNETVVDWASPSDFSSTPGTPRSAVLSAGVNSSAGGDALVSFWDAEAGVYGVDLSRRPMFEEMCAEDLVFIGGCEHNAVLDLFDRHRYGMYRIRGSDRGMYLDIRRLTCQPHVYITQETTPAGWFADYTWPDETPVFLDATDLYRDIFVEFAAWPPNYTLADFADMLARYIVPMSKQESQFWICLIAVVTSSITAGSSVAIAVESSAGFVVGDVVSVRNFANTARESAVVTAVSSSTSITVDSLDGGYTHSASAPPIIRKVVRGA